MLCTLPLQYSLPLLPLQFSYAVPTNGETGKWAQIFNSDGLEFGGDGVGNFRNDPSSDGGAISIKVPKNGIVVMSRTSI